MYVLPLPQYLYFHPEASPKSRVSWWVNGEMIDDSFEEIAPGKSRNTMKVKIKIQVISSVSINTNLT